MKSPIDSPLFDEQDLQVRQALYEAVVPQSAKNRARQRLALAALDSEAGVLPEMSSAPTPIFSRREVIGHWASNHRRTVSALALAVCMVLAVGAYFLTRPLDSLQLVARCSSYLDQRLDSQLTWKFDETDEAMAFLRPAGLYQMPRSIGQVSMTNVPLGNFGKLWKLTFDGRKDLYVLELHGAAAICGVGSSVQLLQSSSNSWSIAAMQTDQHLVVFMTKDSLEQLLQFRPLA